MPGDERPRADDWVAAPWSRSNRPVARRIIQPLQSFLETEASGGVLLLVAALGALMWANSPWHGSYTTLWDTVLRVDAGALHLDASLGEIVNEGLMTLFFFVVGLEIKRELTTGELRNPRAVALPAIAALGGMVVPAGIYLAVNSGGPGASGWGIPMATDIAFAVGVLTLAARRAPPSLRPFLLALAIVDDIGAIVVIAVFYSDAIHPAALAAAAALLLVMIGLQRIQVRFIPVYVALGMGVWFATLESGVHATIAGVALGLLTPAIAFQRPAAVSEEAHRIADETEDDPEPPDTDAPRWLRLAWLSREAVSPLARLEAGLHPWTSFLIVPLFALANAGVRLTGVRLADATAGRVAIGVVLGLVVGKPVGVTLAGFLAVRARIGALPEGTTWGQFGGAAAVAGVGFTVSLFVADLSFGDAALLSAAKVGILAASVLAGTIGFLVLSRTAHRRHR